MAWFRSLRRRLFNEESVLKAYKRFDNLEYTTSDRIVYHGDSRSLAIVTADGGLKRYISTPVAPKPAVMDGGGTRNTVTTTLSPDVAATYAARGGGAAHPGGNDGNRYLYAIYIPAGAGIALSQLPAGLLAGQMSDNNRRTQEILTLDVPMRHILAVRVTAPNAVNRQVLARAYRAVSALPAFTSIPGNDRLIFENFRTRGFFVVVPV